VNNLNTLHRCRQTVAEIGCPDRPMLPERGNGVATCEAVGADHQMH